MSEMPFVKYTRREDPDKRGKTVSSFGLANVTFVNFGPTDKCCCAMALGC